MSLSHSLLTQFKVVFTHVHFLPLKLQYVANTHVHADHVTGSGEIKNRLKPEGSVKSIISQVSGAKGDIFVKDGDVIECGQSVKLQVLSTPGWLT